MMMMGRTVRWCKAGMIGWALSVCLPGWANGDLPLPNLSAKAATVFDAESGRVVGSKNGEQALPLASITKLMTAMVSVDEHTVNDVAWATPLTITNNDVDTLRHSRSSLPVGTDVTHEEALRWALMSSENRAAHALARTSPGGVDGFVQRMNQKAKEQRWTSLQFTDPTGLRADNVGSSNDVARMVALATTYRRIRADSTRRWDDSPDENGHQRDRHNTNRLIREGQRDEWAIEVSKTGFINESGRCLAMAIRANHHLWVLVVLNDPNADARQRDMMRLRCWVKHRGATNDPSPRLDHR